MTDMREGEWAREVKVFSFCTALMITDMHLCQLHYVRKVDFVNTRELEMVLSGYLNQVFGFSPSPRRSASIRY